MSSLQLPLPIWPVNNCKRSTSTVVTLLRWSMYAITGCPWLSTIKSVILSKDHPTPWLPAPGSSATFGVVSQKYAKVNTVATLRHILPLVTECFPSQAAHPTVISPASQQQPRGSSPQLQPSTFMSDLDVTLCSMLLILQLPLSSSFVQAYSFAIPEGTMDALQCFWSFAQEPSNRLQTACTHSFTSQLAAVVVKQTMKQMRRPHADLNSAALYLEVLLQLMLACPTKQSAVESMAKHGGMALLINGLICHRGHPESFVKGCTILTLMCTDKELSTVTKVKSKEMLLQLRVLNTLSSLMCPEFTTMPSAFAEDEDLSKIALKYFDEHIATFGVSNCALPSMNQLQKLAAMLQLMTGLISYQLNCTTWHVGKAQLWHFLRDHLRTSGEGTSVNSLQPPQKLWEWPHPTQNYWSIRRTIAFRACIVIIWLSCTEEKAAMPDLQGTKTSVLIHLWWLVKNLVSGHLMDEELDEVVELRDTIYKAVQCCAGAEPAVAKALSAVSIHSQGKDCQAGFAQSNDSESTANQEQVAAKSESIATQDQSAAKRESTATPEQIAAKSEGTAHQQQTAAKSEGNAHQQQTAAKSESTANQEQSAAKAAAKRAKKVRQKAKKQEDQQAGGVQADGERLERQHILNRQTHPQQDAVQPVQQAICESELESSLTAAPSMARPSQYKFAPKTAGHATQQPSSNSVTSTEVCELFVDSQHASNPEALSSKAKSSLAAAQPVSEIESKASPCYLGCDRIPASHIIRGKAAAAHFVRHSLRCPLTKGAIQDPVTAADGYTYEHSSIVDYMQHHDVSPVDGQTFGHRQLVKNHVI